MSTIQWTNMMFTKPHVPFLENHSMPYSTPNLQGVKILSSKILELNLRGASFQIVPRTEHLNFRTVRKPKQ